MSDDYLQKLKIQRDYYDRTADNYDEWNIETASAKVVDAWNFERLKSFVGAEKPERCLDLGCGTGRLSHNLLEICQIVYGVDASKNVLEIARRKYPELRLGYAEATSLPYEEEFFDLIVINGSLHHFFNLEGTIKEASRVLRSGGKLAILGEPNKRFGKSNPFWYIFLVYKILRRLYLTILRQQITEEIEPEAETFEPEAMRKVLKANGFEISQAITYDFWPRMENKWFIKKYQHLLNAEQRTVARWWPDRGSAIQIFAIKK